ncbi:MAG: hypothetical protein KDD66_12990 [Bdellovibrionales bacterium]|nr:hypothetical protein [Bdellovibrionales bacterium]
MSESKLQSLDPNLIEQSVALLSRRIAERFPGSSLGNVSKQLLLIAKQAKRRSESIARPIFALRAGSVMLIAVIVAGLVTTLFSLKMPKGGLELVEFIQLLEAGINDVVLIGAAIFFLATFESRIKRTRALRAVHELRTIAHLIDMHQLTKDPERLLSAGPVTESSPKRTMTAFELGRYLDYCSEMLSLTGKVAAIYVQSFEDEVALAAVNEIENLTTGLSRKVWQKLMILHTSKTAA